MTNFLNPVEVLKKMDLKKDMTAADFGSGAGGWTIPLAKLLQEGKVFAIDVLEEPLSALKGKAKTENLSNIEIIRGNIEINNGSKLNDSCVDLVLITNLLFQAEDKKGVLQEAERILKKGGKILVIDWKKDSPYGPKENTVSKEEVKKIAEELKLNLDKEIDAGPYHWGLILVK